MTKTNQEHTADLFDMEMFDYEEIHPGDETSSRILLRVPGGWVYEVQTGLGVSTTFVPIPENQN